MLKPLLTITFLLLGTCGQPADCPGCPACPDCPETGLDARLDTLETYLLDRAEMWQGLIDEGHALDPEFTWFKSGKWFAQLDCRERIRLARDPETNPPQWID